MTTPADQIVSDLILHTSELLRVNAGLDASVQLELRSLVGQLEAVLLANDPTSDARVLSRLIDRMSEVVRASFAYIGSGTTTLLQELAAAQTEVTMRILNNAVRAAVAGRLSKAMTDAIASGQLMEGAPSSEWWARQSVILQQRFTDEMRQGLALGEGMGDLLRRIRGRREFGFTDGIMQTTSARARAIIHTSAMNVANAAREATFIQNSDIVGKTKWIITFDDLVCVRCRALSNLVWTLPDHVPVGHDKEWPGVSLHWNDRCIQVPVLNDWESISGLKGMTNIPVGTRASMTGQVPADMTYDGWLRTQPAATQREILGVGRWELWRAGKIGLSEMTDMKNRPLTIAQLRRRAGLE